MDSIVLQVLQQDLEDWQLKHTCAACTYKLTDEPGLKFKLLYAMDGNDSLKHVLRCLSDEIADNHPLSHDLPTSQILTSSHYVSHEYVNKFAMAGSKDPISNIDLDSNPCAGHWKNMDDAKTKKIWGVHDETGIFMAVCRHGTCLLIADMVQSGEWAKYLLATVSKLMAAFGDGLGGYKLWKHIAKALQTHSAAIKAALECYNKCALAMQPPHQTLQWEQVIEYAFLANFDLLRDTHEDISKHPWAHPTVCFALDTYFKMCQAKEEIECLNIKIHQVITYMCDKERFLRTCEEKINSIHPALAHQVSQCHKLHSQFNASHLKRLHDIALLLGFSGTIYPGESALKGPGESNSEPAIIIPTCLLAPIQPPPSQIVHRNTLDSIQDLEEEEEAECEAEEASHALQDVLESTSTALSLYIEKSPIPNGSVVLEIRMLAVSDNEHGVHAHCDG
ncbi:hypothetical protein PISMIDRAFT_10544 [Pisolithus microcarpus 441]|uniref:Uncharacterized protein n=1 Tax=Pisolithus microcarpus 441 TaxID=765257 RepID=A0A0C9ZNM0_9AGAM|nr:hypothetical protein PISMIDRAFT_10544 [Pisolithus microcarpus 441]